MRISIFLGPAGSGKGTQAELLSKNILCTHISTGDLLRKEVKKSSPLGIRVKDIMNRGELVSDDIMIDIIKAYLTSISDDNDSHLIFDGFPRTIQQAKQFDKLLLSLNITISNVIYFDLTLEDSIRRISGRRIDPNTKSIYHMEFNPPPVELKDRLIIRDDDKPEKVISRYDVYKRQTEPLVKFYNSKIRHINCSQTIDDIHNQILRVLNQ